MDEPEVQKIKLSVILPCRNEEESLGDCLAKINRIVVSNNIAAEIIVSDSSSDKSPQIAAEMGAKLVKHDKVGYGIAYQEGFNAACGDYLFLADADCSYDFCEIPAFLKELENGHDFVIGNRFGKKMVPNSMPWANRYFGNPILSYLLRLMSGARVKDAHSGMRAISREALDKLELKTAGMEFASEMILEAMRNNLKIKELPIEYFPRKGISKLRPVMDGWRHLKLILSYAVNSKS